MAWLHGLRDRPQLFHLLTRVGGIVLLLCGSTACSQTRPAWNLAPSSALGTTPSPIAPSRTIEPTFGPQGRLSPPTIRAYIEQTHLERTQRLEFFDPQMKQTRVIQDPHVIQRVLDLLMAPRDPVDPARKGPQQSFLLIMIVPVGSGEYSVSANYDPQTNTLSLGNVLSGYLPLSIRGTYSVPPTFGRALFEILNLPSTPTSIIYTDRT
jgi:hypothetical protein